MRIIDWSADVCSSDLVPGSNASDSTEIYQEGLRIPVLKLYDQGEPNHTLMQMIERNVRVPDRVLGDLQAQYAACQVGANHLAKLYERRGNVETDSYLRAVIEYEERLKRVTGRGVWREREGHIG